MKYQLVKSKVALAFNNKCSYNSLPENRKLPSCTYVCVKYELEICYGFSSYWSLFLILQPDTMAEWLNFVPPLLLLMVYLCECSLEFVEECALKGFTPNLMCSTCEMMDEFNLSPIKSSCLQCCHKDEVEQTGPVKYPYAELVVSFVKSDRPNQFPGLTVRYVRGADPIIKLLDENHNVVETLGIDKWNTDSVEEFFLEHLQR
ncbi:hypothetical protein Btru_050023 [Bulinus truncatus]|nr:hypothetical protein Btru_050023 [Bulinus truncatus]